MNAKQMTDILKISNVRLNQLRQYLSEGQHYERIHAKCIRYKPSALKILQERKKKYLEKQTARH